MSNRIAVNKERRMLGALERRELNVKDWQGELSIEEVAESVAKKGNTYPEPFNNVTYIEQIQARIAGIRQKIAVASREVNILKSKLGN